MPLDSLTYAATVAPTSLADLGLSAISPLRVARWKAGYMQRFADKSSRNRMLVASERARWIRTEPAPLIHFGSTSYYNYACHLSTKAPDDVHRLVSKISGIKDAEFSIEFFDKDPILYVHLRDAFGKPISPCVAIWDRKVIRAVSHGFDLSLKQKVLRQMVIHTI